MLTKYALIAGGFAFLGGMTGAYLKGVDNGKNQTIAHYERQLSKHRNASLEASQRHANMMRGLIEQTEKERAEQAEKERQRIIALNKVMAQQQEQSAALRAQYEQKIKTLETINEQESDWANQPVPDSVIEWLRKL